jgi:uncharacterized protein YggE
VSARRDESGITVTGIGEAPAQPDLMTVDLGVSFLAATVAEGRSSATQRTNDLIAALTGKGVDRGEIRTTRYSIHPEYDHRDGEQRLRGYRVTNELQLAVRDLTMAGELIDAAAEAGSNDVTVNNVSFSVEDKVPTRVAAREGAWEDARSRAEHLAQLSGCTLGRVVSIVETTGDRPGPGPVPRMAVAETTPVETGTTTVTVMLDVRFAIE